MSINELESEQKDWALSMLCRSGVLSPCRHHEGVYVDEGIDIESAYKYSMKVISLMKTNPHSAMCEK